MIRWCRIIDLETMWEEVEMSWYEVLAYYLPEMTENNHESLCQENVMYIIVNYFQSVSVFKRSIFFSEDSSAVPSWCNICSSFNIFNSLFVQYKIQSVTILFCTSSPVSSLLFWYLSVAPVFVLWERSSQQLQTILCLEIQSTSSCNKIHRNWH
jgi:hypothetical protein